MPKGIGPHVVDWIYDAMKIDGEWSLRERHGFKWWPWALAQRVWYEGPIKNRGVNLYRIHARTDLVKGFPDSDESWALLGVAGAFAMLSGIIRDPEDTSRLQLASSVWVHEEIAEFMKPMLLGVIALQAVEAHRLGPALAQDGVGELAVSEHPVGGLREVADEMLDIVENVFQPAGEETLALGKDLATAAEVLMELGCFVTSDESQLAADFSLTGDPISVRIGLGRNEEDLGSSLIQISTDQPHPFLGNGVLIVGKVGPWLNNPPNLAIELNEFELSNTLFAHSWGSWCVDQDGGLARITFVPKALYKSGALSNLAICAYQQMKNALEELTSQNVD
ncbi:MAG: hypothetical protein ABI718_08085 [Acidobacteriota bacterium]